MAHIESEIKQTRNYPVVPWEFHTDIPDGYTIKFVYEPEPQLTNEQVMFVVFGRNWDIVRYRQGLGSLMFPCENGNVNINDDDTDMDEEPEVDRHDDSYDVKRNDN
jgi:hypothetical protein